MSEKIYTFKITIDDGQCAYQYEIPNDGEAAIFDIAEAVRKFLGSDEMLIGTYIGNSEQKTC